jgi:hypothetical protein
VKGGWREEGERVKGHDTFMPTMLQVNPQLRLLLRLL